MDKAILAGAVYKGLPLFTMTNPAGFQPPDSSTKSGVSQEDVLFVDTRICDFGCVRVGMNLVVPYLSVGRRLRPVATGTDHTYTGGGMGGHAAPLSHPHYVPIKCLIIPLRGAPARRLFLKLERKINILLSRVFPLSDCSAF